MIRSASSVSFLLAMAWAAPVFAQEAPPALPPPSAPAPGAVSRPAPGEPPMVIYANPEQSPPSGAAAPSTPEASKPAEAAAPEGPPRHDLIRVNAGFRIGYIPSRAFDQFATNDVLAQTSIDGTYPLLSRGKLVLGAGLGWDFGARSDSLRGLSTSLSVHRLYVPIEGRYHVSPALAVFGKVAPGAIAALTSFKDDSAPDELSATGWAFSTDLSAGATILLGPRQRMDQRTPRFWVTPEIGYALTTRAPVRPNPNRDEKDLLGSDENANLRSLALSGFFWRASVGLTF